MLPLRALLIGLFAALTAFSQLPKIEPGVSQDLAKWRSVQYSNISYKLNLTLEKMSPVLKGSMEIHVTQAASACAEPNCPQLALILDWRKLAGHEKDSTLSNVTLNGSPLVGHEGQPYYIAGQRMYWTENEHLIFDQGVRMGENVITLDFTSPILTSGSAITRYIDKEDGSEYIYSLFVPSDASTAFPVFDQPDLKAKFTLTTYMAVYDGGMLWKVVSNSPSPSTMTVGSKYGLHDTYHAAGDIPYAITRFPETKPISTYVFAFAAGPWKEFTDTSRKVGVELKEAYKQWLGNDGGIVTHTDGSIDTHIYVRKSQAAKFQPHAAETFRLTREAVKYLETYFDYKFPWPKYDLVLIPEFPFGGMEHAGATFLKESSVIFPTEPTKGDQLSRANVIFHETAHQWFGDLVTMRWFDDLWLKEGFAEFMAYKTLEHVMPDANAWKVFYERNKQAAYATDSTRGTTPVYQKIDNLSAAKSAYGNIVYRKAPSFLRQAEFYLGPDKFQTAVRAFLKKHAFGNAGWEDLVREFINSQNLDSTNTSLDAGDDRAAWQRWANCWVNGLGLTVVHSSIDPRDEKRYLLQPSVNESPSSKRLYPWEDVQLMAVFDDGSVSTSTKSISPYISSFEQSYAGKPGIKYIFPNYGDYGYGIFLLDDKSRAYVLKHIGEEKDPFLRSMMWGALWDSVREAELDPREYVELVIRQLGVQSSSFSLSQRRTGSTSEQAKACTLNCGETDETTIQSLLGRVSTALNYYLPTPNIALIPAPRGAAPAGAPDARTSATSDLRSQFEAVLLDRMQHAETPGLRVTFYRAFVTNATTEHGRGVLKQMLAGASTTPAAKPATPPNQGGESVKMTLRTKDKFDIVTRLIVLGDPDAPKLLADLEKTETSDDAKRYAYAAHAAFATAENRAKFWSDFVNNKEISESWIEAAIGPFNSIRHPELSQPYLARALAELPNLKRTRKIFFINNWLSAWLGGQRDQAALDFVNKFLADNPTLDNDLRLKVLENVDVIERAVKIRQKFAH